MAFTNRFHYFTISLPAGLCLCGLLGCATLTTPAVAPLAAIPSLGDMLDREEPIAEPKGVAVVWTNAVLEKEASQPTRGFGGMVTFYGEDRKKPIRVDGQLTVYAYADMSAEREDPVPDRKYVFKPEQLAKHYGVGPLGPSYSIWIPWDAAGGARKEIGLITRFDSTEGTTVMSKPTHNVLEGPIAARKTADGVAEGGEHRPTAASPGSAEPSCDEKNGERKKRRAASLPPGMKARPFGDSDDDKPKMKTVTLTVPLRHQNEVQSSEPR
jgi:hypothetical protein